MATSPVTVPSFGTNQKVRATFTYFDFNGVLDTTTVMNLSSDSAAIATITIDPVDGRKVWITGVAQGTTTVRINAPTAVGPGGPLQYTVTVTAPPNQSHIEHVSFEAAVNQ